MGIWKPIVNFHLNRILSLTRIWKHYERCEELENCGHGMLSNRALLLQGRE